MESEIRFLPRRGGPRGPKQSVGYRVDPESGCWIWTGHTLRGYARTTGGQASRLAYEQFVGPIPEECDLHHRCSNKACVNPEHLEPRPVSRHRGKPGTLSQPQIDLLWKLLRQGEPLETIASRLRVTVTFLRGVKLETIYEPKRTGATE